MSPVSWFFSFNFCKANGVPFSPDCIKERAFALFNIHSLSDIVERRSLIFSNCLLVVVITLTVKSYGLLWIESFYHFVKGILLSWMSSIKNSENFCGWPNLNDFTEIIFFWEPLFKTLKSKEDKTNIYVNEKKMNKKRIPWYLLAKFAF